MNNLKQLANNNRHAFLLTLFDKVGQYSVKEMNGFHLIQQFNREVNRWEVAIYTKESYLKRLKFQNARLI